MNKKKKRMDGLLKKAADTLWNCADPFNHEFLTENEVTADECIQLSQTMSIVIKGYLGSDAGDQAALVGIGAIYDEGPELVKMVRSSLKLSQTTKKLKAMH